MVIMKQRRQRVCDFFHCEGKFAFLPFCQCSDTANWII